MAINAKTEYLKRRSVLKSMAVAGVLSIGAGEVTAQPSSRQSQQASRLQDVVPRPVEVESSSSSFTLTHDSRISVDSDESREVAKHLAKIIRPSTGYELPVVEGESDWENTEQGPTGGLSLRIFDAQGEEEDDEEEDDEEEDDEEEDDEEEDDEEEDDEEEDDEEEDDLRGVGEEGYHLKVTSDSILIRANDSAGLFNGIQTFRQLLPAEIESNSEQSGPWTVLGGHITDYPRFDYRGAHLDVARHFFDVDTIKRYIDHLAQYKVNYLHLHLTDDQGWRIEIDSWPNLTDEGADSEVGGTAGGYYTKEEYVELVEYAQNRFVTVIPEIDMPGHTGAALESYAELNCDGEKRPEDTGVNVGDTSLCVDKEITFEFVNDVIEEVAEMTPGPYLHLGGDEAHSTSDEEYDYFMDRVVPMVLENGKQPIGWHQILGADPTEETIAQFWGTNSNAPEVAAAAEEGHELIMSPANRAYLDMDYNEQDGVGQDWAGNTSVKDSYTWNPGAYIDDVNESSIIGPETALWTEFVETADEVEYMTFPRLPAIAELGWSPDGKTNWTEFRQRLAAQGPRWDVQDINYYKSTQIPWPK
ncbi:family 20 glycosylhydrolase [Halococcus sediminicola]|uniref:family 20 glycosylhydrolase n=1 Tax=Halococcus sediminicola TaxID=1264579 RepID=UPI000AA2ACB6|nr:family 20 glycosylhydrolase [Halococcus sediminicola]